MRVVFILTLMVGALGLVATPAEAAATTKTWTFTGGCCIYVPGGTGTDGWFTTNVEKNIYFKIGSMTPCVKDPQYGYPKITIELWKDEFPLDNTIGNDKTIECTGVAKWSMVNPGKYHFHMIIQNPWRNRYTYTMSGKYAYNGATL